MIRQPQDLTFDAACPACGSIHAWTATSPALSAAAQSPSYAYPQPCQTPEPVPDNVIRLLPEQSHLAIPAAAAVTPGRWPSPSALAHAGAHRIRISVLTRRLERLDANLATFIQLADATLEEARIRLQADMVAALAPAGRYPGDAAPEVRATARAGVLRAQHGWKTAQEMYAARVGAAAGQAAERREAIRRAINALNYSATGVTQ